MAEVVFYQIPISHFCEKIRWALDYKRIPYQPVSVNPFTRKELGKMCRSKQVPVIKHGDRIVFDSSEIVRYLDETWPDPPLVPQKEPERKTCLELELLADEAVGPAVRRLAYRAVFEDRPLFARLFLAKSGAGRLLNPLRRRLITFALCRHFGITRHHLDEDRTAISLLLAGLQARLGGRAYFVGDGLTIADIALASLMNPLELVSEFSQSSAYSGIFEWMRRTRREHGRSGWRP